MVTSSDCNGSKWGRSAVRYTNRVSANRDVRGCLRQTCAWISYEGQRYRRASGDEAQEELGGGGKALESGTKYCMTVS